MNEHRGKKERNIMISFSLVRGSILVVLISMLMKWLSSSAPNLKPVSVCPFHVEQHRLEENEKAKWDSPLCVFSESYQEARDKFRRAANSIPRGELYTLDVLPDVDPGAYTIDIFLLRSEKENAGLAVHSSGTHGVEGYAGSAVQISYLYQLAASSSEELNLDSTILLIHAVNPFGMAHFRRYNENNVDLNRNGFLSAEEFQIEQSRDPNFGGYEDLSKGLLNPQHEPTYWDAYIGFLCKAAYYILAYGFLNVKRALVSGQYHNPKGIMFGGTKLERSHVLLKDFLVKHGFTGSIQNHEPVVTWVDLHTGLGPSGIDTMLVANEFKEETERWFTDLPRPFASEDVTAGYDLSKGFMNDFYTQLFPKNKSMQPLIITQEFGTIAPVLVARAMILENSAFHYSAHEHHAWWSQFTRDAFYVRSTKWRKSILDRGMTVWRQAIKRSSYQSMTST